MQKIAVLDDDERWCFSVQRYLRQQFEVEVFTDAQSLLRSSIAFHLIIVDFTILPVGEFEAVINGCQLIQYLKRTLVEPPPMILASGYISPKELEDEFLSQSLCAEADGFLAKDAGLESVLRLVQHLLTPNSPRLSLEPPS